MQVLGSNATLYVYTESQIIPSELEDIFKNTHRLRKGTEELRSTSLIPVCVQEPFDTWNLSQF